MRERVLEEILRFEARLEQLEQELQWHKVESAQLVNRAFADALFAAARERK